MHRVKQGKTELKLLLRDVVLAALPANYPGDKGLTFILRYKETSPPAKEETSGQ